MTSTEVIHRNALEIVEGFASARHMVKPKKQWGENGNKPAPAHFLPGSFGVSRWISVSSPATLRGPPVLY